MIEIKAYTKKELCAMYGVSYPTFVKWIKYANIIHLIDRYSSKRILTPNDVAIIVEKLGEP
jgi:predicted site-specific integrase-resolvase